MAQRRRRKTKKTTNEKQAQRRRTKKKKKTAAKACDVCFNLDLSSKPHSKREIDTTVKSLVASSQQGCRSCHILSTILQPYVLYPDKDHVESDYGDHQPCFLFRRYEYNSRGLFGIPYFLQLFTLKESSCPWPAIHPEPSKFSAESAVPQVAAWIEQCIKGHDFCQNTSALPHLPTRVLEIQDPRQVRLYIPTEPVTSHYLCLSHCWGGRKPIETTTSNQQQFQKGIPWSMLPRTFQDALDLTARLGHRFLWIDSLCILQDDIKDWRCESSKMQSIYSCSYLTIAATNSPNAYGGLYSQPAVNEWDRTHIFKEHGATPYSIHVRQAPNHDHFDHERLPLLERAWGFQENLLSPRVVHFADQELYWECMTETRCECGRYYPSQRQFSKAKYLLRDDAVGGKALPARMDSVSPTADRWRMTVASYSSRTLTFERDMLPALQGIAKQFQTETKCAYFAGLWEKSFLGDLLWHFNIWSDDQILQSQAPSWSWASKYRRFNRDSGGPARLLRWGIPNTRNTTYTEEATVLSVSTTLIGSDPMGEVSSGQLKLKGRCLKAAEYKDTVAEESTMEQMCRELRPFDLTHVIDRALKVRRGPKGTHIACIGERGGEGWYPDCSQDAPYMQDIILMAIIRENKTNGENGTLHCLGFQKIKGEDQDTYRRVGAAIIYNSVKLKEGFEKWGEMKTITIE